MKQIQTFKRRNFYLIKSIQTKRDEALEYHIPCFIYQF